MEKLLQKMVCKDNKNLIFLVAMITLQVVVLTILVFLSHILLP